MKLNILTVIFLLFSCKNSAKKQVSSLNGYWISPDYSNIALKIDDLSIEEIYPLESRKLFWKYQLIQDTLLMFNSKGDSSLHILEFRSKDTIRLRPLIVQVDISVIDNFDLVRTIESN